MNEVEKGQLSIDTVQCFTSADGSLSNFPRLLKRVIDEKVWLCRSHHGHTIKLRNLRELITSKPIKGWGQDPKKIEAVIRDDAEVLAMFRDAMKGQEGGDKRSDKAITNNNVISDVTPQGNSRAYSIDRVKRDAPEFAAAVLSGKMSPNAALVKAGIRENRQVYIPRDPIDAAEKLTKCFGMDFVRELADALAKQG